MSKFCSLFSSSKGNSTFLASNSTRILVDAGVTCKRLSEALISREIDPASISGILITHEHSDHVKAIKVFCTKYNVPIYASAGTLKGIENTMLNGKFEVNKIVPGESFIIGDLKINSFPTPHDSRQSCCYTVEFPDDRIASVATDIGVMNDTIHNAIKKSDLVLLESNHDVQMLMTGNYPYDLKRRIRSEKGHLSNEDCAKECLELLNGKTTRFFLGHLSEENNMPLLAYKTTASEFEQNSAKIGVDCLLEVCKTTGDGQVVRF